MAGDWQELGQAAAIGLLFAFLVAKLISTVIAFKEDNLRITRSPPTSPTAAAAAAPPVPSHYGSTDGGSGSDSDWEGVESTELDEEFSAASAFIAASAASGTSVPEEAQLRLYGLYKIATEGPCTAPQPSALKLKARAKWNAWHKLGAMPTEEAMQGYITIVQELFPNWDAGASAVSSVDTEGRSPLHWAVDRGHLSAVEVLANANADLNAKDNEGQTALHYAAVCEREDIAELLVKHHADLRIKDEDGNTAHDLCPSSWSFMNQAN
ncbi:Acyl-CoA-binding domain-containing protein 1 [Zea mays]|uniref:Acyl-CoA-binding domain-containing protein 1 n=1 Tax=Zea mays TaxID=4577 RepID=A0A3L6G037_MAIZE|nr:Acyl-CoA-binding domain-containing protein 1 [Zea mays]